jgi:hypothetical protein
MWSIKVGWKSRVVSQKTKEGLDSKKEFQD